MTQDLRNRELQLLIWLHLTVNYENGHNGNIQEVGISSTIKTTDQQQKKPTQQF